jgi:predicted component of type VI protein secretion system
MEIQLLVTKRESEASYSSTFALADRVVLGRDLSSPIELEGSGISREHFALVGKDGSVFIQDLSTNGTWLNSRDLAKQTHERVRNGDVIEVPGYQLEVRLPEEASPAGTIAGAGPSGSPPARKLKWFGPIAKVLPAFTWLEMLVMSASISSFVLIWYYATN